MILSSKVIPIVANVLDAPWTNNWQLLYDEATGNGFDRPLFMLRIINDSDQPFFVSYNRTVPHDFVRANDKIQIYFQPNALQTFTDCNMPQGTRVWILGIGGTGLAICTGYSSYRD